MKKNKIDIWDKSKYTYAKKKYRADAFFYPHGCFGYCYRGNIYDDQGTAIGDYATNDSCWIEDTFLISFG